MAILDVSINQMLFVQKNFKVQETMLEVMHKIIYQEFVE